MPLTPAILASIAMLLAAGCVTTPPHSDALSREAAADALLQQVLKEDGGPGVMAAVVKDGVLLWSGAGGIADLEQNIPMGNSHLLRIGSVSKPITAVLAAIESQLGEINLDADIRLYIPEFPEKAGTITIRRLGSHIAGIRQYDFSNYYEANNVIYRSSLSEGIAAFANDPLVAKPGDKFEYASLGYNLIGAVIERATGASFAEELNAKLTGPMQLSNTMTDNPFDVIPRRAGFYTVSTANPVFPWMKDGVVINTIMRDSSDYYPSGGLLSSAEDLAAFAYQTFNSGILNADSIALILTPATLNDGARAELETGHGAVPYSFGWQLREAAGDMPLSYGHDGETNGAYALIRYFPKSRTAVAAITNYNLVARESAFFTLLSEDLPALFFD